MSMDNCNLFTDACGNQLNVYIQGNKLRFNVLIVDYETSNPVDPTELYFFAENQSGIIKYQWQTDSEIVQDATGSFHIDVALDVAGHWSCCWQSLGNGEAASFEEFLVRATCAKI